MGKRHKKSQREIPIELPQKKQNRTFKAADAGRLVSGWTTTNQSADEAIYRNLKALRARSREQAVNNDYARRFLSMVVKNVVGPRGIVLQSRAVFPGGQPDLGGNAIIEKEWEKWSRRGQCDVTGQFSWQDVQSLFIRAVVRDGECLVRLVPGYRNDHRFAVQVVDADHLDDQLNDVQNSGGRIRMGVEKDQWGRPVAYHLFENHPGDMSLQSAVVRSQYVRIDASMLVHGFMADRPGQTRGVPWLHTALLGMRHLSGYQEAAIVAARNGAATMGFFTAQDGESFPGDDEENGNVITEAEPGTFHQLPVGMDVKEWSPDYPHQNYDAFVKTTLRGIASGLDVSYHSLANDLEGVNFSSIRSGTLEDRDAWRMVQAWMAGALCPPVYEAWLKEVLRWEVTPIGIDKFEKFRFPHWQPRGWDWVDPQKDIEANTRAVALGVKSRGQVAAEQGRDLEDVFRDLANERTQAKALGLELEPAPKAGFSLPEKGGNDGDQEN